MVRLHATLADHRHAARIVLQVHDELLLEVQADALGATAEAVMREMEGVAALRVPLKVDVKTGPNWAELERL
jgi:DNA polymerase I